MSIKDESLFEDFGDLGEVDKELNEEQIILAIENDALDIFKLLINRGVTVKDISIGFGMSAFEYAIKCQSNAILQEMLNTGIHDSLKGEYQRSRKASVIEVEESLDQRKGTVSANYDIRDESDIEEYIAGSPPIIIAALYGDVKTLELLLEAKSDINATDYTINKTPLMWAADAYFFEYPDALSKIEFLIKQGADITTIFDDNGDNSLAYLMKALSSKELERVLSFSPFDSPPTDWLGEVKLFRDLYQNIINNLIDIALERREQGKLYIEYIWGRGGGILGNEILDAAQKDPYFEPHFNVFNEIYSLMEDWNKNEQEYEKVGLTPLMVAKNQSSAEIIRRIAENDATLQFKKPKSKEKIFKIEEGTFAIDNKHTSLLKEFPHVFIPESVSAIREKAFTECVALKRISYPKSIEPTGKWVVSIEERAIKWKHNLNNLNIPGFVKSIGNQAFLGCSSVESVVLGEGVTTIGNEVFGECKSLQYIEMPSSVISIGDEIFKGSTALNTIVVERESYAHKFLRDTNYIKLLYTKVANEEEIYEFPEGTSTIEKQNDELLNNSKVVIIPSSAISFWEGAFSELSSLEKIVLHPENKYFILDKGVLYDRRYHELLAYPPMRNNILYKVLGKSGSISSEAFANNKYLKQIVLSERTWSIYEGLFSQCSSLKVIKVPLENKNLLSMEGVLFNKEKTKLISYPNMKANAIYKIPAEVKIIEKLAFNDCKFLEEISIPKSVNEIGENNFNNCPALKSILVKKGSYGHKFFQASKLKDFIQLS